MSKRSVSLNLRDAGVAMCPIIALGVVRIWLGASGPATATAATPDAAVPIAGLTNYQEHPITDLERDVLKEIARMAMLGAPDVFPRRTVAIDADPLIGNLPPIDPGHNDQPATEQLAPALIVTSIMGGRSPVAIIDGRARRIGERVGPGWTITAIADGRVSVTHLDGRVEHYGIERDQP